MPEAQDDCVVVRMANLALRVQLRVSHHLDPIAAPLRDRQRVELIGDDGARVARADVDPLAAGPVSDLEDVCLPPAASERLVPKDVLLVDLERPLRHEKPLALPDV